MNRKYLALVFTLLAALVIVGCAGPPAEEPAQEQEAAEEEAAPEEAESEMEEEQPAEEEMADMEPVRVGVAMSYSGPMAFVGEASDKGTDVALELLGGEVAGHPIEVYTADNECNPEKAISAVRSLVENDNVDIILGSGCSSSTLAAMTVLEELQVPQVVSVSSSPVIAEDSGESGNRWNFVHSVGSPILASQLVGYAADSIDSAAILANNDDFGRGAAEQLELYLNEEGVDIVTTEYYEFGAPDFRPLLLRIKQLDPDGLMLVAAEPDASQVFRQFRELDMDQQIFGLGTIATPLLLEMLSDEPGIADGILNIAWYTEGMDPDFDAAYQDMWNEPPIPNASMMYHAMRYVVAPAIEIAAADSGEVNAATLRDALEQVSAESPVGLIDFNESNHQAYQDLAIITIENHEVVLGARIVTRPE